MNDIQVSTQQDDAIRLAAVTRAAKQVVVVG